MSTTAHQHALHHSMVRTASQHGKHCIAAWHALDEAVLRVEGLHGGALPVRIRVWHPRRAARAQRAAHRALRRQLLHERHRRGQAHAAAAAAVQVPQQRRQRERRRRAAQRAAQLRGGRDVGSGFRGGWLAHGAGSAGIE